VNTLKKTIVEERFKGIRL